MRAGKVVRAPTRTMSVNIFGLKNLVHKLFIIWQLILGSRSPVAKSPSAPVPPIRRSKFSCCSQFGHRDIFRAARTNKYKVLHTLTY